MLHVETVGKNLSSAFAASERTLTWQTRIQVAVDVANALVSFMVIVSALIVYVIAYIIDKKLEV